MARITSDLGALNHLCVLGCRLAVGESSVILLHLPLPLAGVSIAMGRGCQQNDSLADGRPADDLLAATAGPVVAVMVDVDSRPGRGAAFGDGMARQHRKCGCARAGGSILLLNPLHAARMDYPPSIVARITPDCCCGRARGRVVGAVIEGTVRDLGGIRRVGALRPLPLHLPLPTATASSSSHPHPDSVLWSSGKACPSVPCSGRCRMLSFCPHSMVVALPRDPPH